MTAGSKYHYVFGPVNSRRLGRSLGIDVVPLKTCTYNCVYCQLGRTTLQTLSRREYVPVATVLAELEDYLTRGVQADYLTFSGSGEPTLHVRLGEMIAAIKRMSNLPVVVFTCGALLPDPQVRRELALAALVNCSLDAATDATFQALDRPHGKLALPEVLEALQQFRRDYHGELWLQIMLIRGMNDHPEEIAALREMITKIAPARVHLNTAVRPPAESAVRALSRSELQAIAAALGPPAEVIVEHAESQQSPTTAALDAQIKNLIARHPATLSQIAASLGRDLGEVAAAIDELLRLDEIHTRHHAGQDFYAPASAQSA